jgi:exonuclease III
LKFLTWNIRHGGAKSTDAIIDALKKHQADVILLTEFRNRTAPQLRQALHDLGWLHQIASNPQGNDNGLLFAAKMPILMSPEAQPCPVSPQRWLDIVIPSYRFKILGVHIPLEPKRDKKLFWADILAYGIRYKSTEAIIMGDFNTGLSQDTEASPFRFPEYMESLLQEGWIDAWRYLHPNTRDFTWYSPKPYRNGFRLDHAFLSPSVFPQLITAHLAHRERLLNISDHSMLIAELDLKPVS